MLDKQNGTSISNEAYKEQYCHSKGILLLNLWSNQSEEEVLDQIDSAISSRINDPSLTPYEFGYRIPYWIRVIFFIVSIPLWLVTALALFGVLYRSLINGHNEYYGYVWCQPLAFGSLTAALLFVLGSCLESDASKRFPSKAALALTLLFGAGSGLSLYSTIYEQDPLSGYLAPQKYSDSSPFSQTVTGYVHVEDDFVYWTDNSDSAGRELEDSIEQAITDLGYEDDAENIYQEALNEPKNSSMDIRIPDVLKGEPCGYAYFTADGKNYILVRTQLSNAGALTFYAFYIYQL